MPEKALVLGCHSQSAICFMLAQTILMRYHFINEVLEDGLITLIKVNTSKNPIDALTMCLAKVQHQLCIYRWWELLGLKEPPWSFKWEVVWDKGHKDSPFLYILNLPCESSIFFNIFGPNFRVIAFTLSL